MKIFKSSLITIIGLFLFSSCGTINRVNEKFILGSWKFDKVVTYNPSSSEHTSSSSETADKQTKALSPSNISDSYEVIKLIKESIVNKDISALADRFPEMITAIEFKSDKTAHVTTRKISINGTWKINRTGTKIKIKASDTKKTTQIEIKDVGFTSLEIVDPLPNGSFVLLFKK
jgi:hypothetical protein